MGRCPRRIGNLNSEQESFLDQSISGLAQDGKIISVRLALFAEMMKGKPWTPPRSKRSVAPEGVGVTFLEETFSASTAPPEHRLHQKAAQAVLKALLARERHRHQGADEITPGIAGRIRLCEPPQGLR